MQRISVLAPDHTPLMPTKRTRAEKWVEAGRAEWVKTDLRLKAVRLLEDPSGRQTQPIALGIDPGKHYAGMAVQSAKATLFAAHLILPFETVRKRMDNRRLMRRSRRSRRIDRTIPFAERAHRQKRFNNRRQKKVPPSIGSNRQLEYRVAQELCRLFPISTIVYESVRADVDLTSRRKKARSGKGFSPVMVGQNWAINRLSELARVHKLEGWQTAAMRQQLGLEKQKYAKGEAKLETHAVDGIALACSEFWQYQSFQMANSHGHHWVGSVKVTSTPFVVIRRSPISRRQLHLIVPRKGGKRRKYGGTVTRHGFRKGDLVRAEMAGRIMMGYVSGDTARQVSVSDFNWKRLGQFRVSKVQLLYRATHILVTCPQRVSVSGAKCFAA